MPSKLEPEFGQRVSDEALVVDESPAPSGVRIDAPREAAAPSLPKPANVMRPPRVARGGAAVAAAATAESFDDDDLEIPAFLRRRAN